MIFNTGWYLIYTRPRHERKLAQQLELGGIETFLPTQKVLKQWRHRRKMLEQPVFPSYLFVFLKEVKNYYHCLAADGALYFVRYGKEIARVSDSIISSIRTVVKHSDSFEVDSITYSPGEKLVISEGAFAGLEGEVVSQNGKERVLIRVSILQRNILLTLPVTSLVNRV